VSRRLLTLLVLALVAGPLAACGKKGTPTPPPGGDTHYPRSYPAPSND
jgi:predicted small lipoprotein YifL